MNIKKFKFLITVFISTITITNSYMITNSDTSLYTLDNIESLATCEVSVDDSKNLGRCAKEIDSNKEICGSRVTSGNLCSGTI